MINDINIHINNCVECAKYKSVINKKKIKNITILSKGPKDRYVADLWELPEDSKGKSNYKYIITVIDHFSKFTQSYLLNTKESL